MWSWTVKIVTRFIPTDDAARERLLHAWSLAGPLGELVARRAARAVAEH